MLFKESPWYKSEANACISKYSACGEKINTAEVKITEDVQRRRTMF